MYICRDDIGDGIGTSVRQTRDTVEGTRSIRLFEGSNSLVRHTRELTYYMHPRDALNWPRAAAVVVEAMGDDGAGASTDLLLEVAHFCFSVADKDSLMLVGVSSNAISGVGATTLSHVNFEHCLQEDYCTEHGGTSGPQQQSENIKTSSSNVQTEATRTTGRPDEVCCLASLPHIFFAQQLFCPFKTCLFFQR